MFYSQAGDSILLQCYGWRCCLLGRVFKPGYFKEIFPPLTWNHPKMNSALTSLKANPHQKFRAISNPSHFLLLIYGFFLGCSVKWRRTEHYNRSTTRLHHHCSKQQRRNCISKKIRHVRRRRFSVSRRHDVYLLDERWRATRLWRSLSNPRRSWVWYGDDSFAVT